jgi:hypothetical protein
MLAMFVLGLVLAPRSPGSAVGSHKSVLKLARKAAGLKPYEAYHALWLTDSSVITSPGGARNVFVKVDILSGKRTTLDGLAKLYKTMGGYGDDMVISPDGNLVAFSVGTEREDEWLVADLHGKKVLSFRATRRSHVTHSGVSGSSYVRWLKDSRTLAEITEEEPEGTRFVTFRLIDTKDNSVRTVRVNRQSDSAYTGWAIITMSDEVVWDSWSAPHYVHLADPAARDVAENSDATFVRWQLGSPAHPKMSTTRPPNGSRIRGLLMSPRGDRLAWMVEQKSGSWLLYVSKPDGTMVNELGILPKQSANDAQYSLEWLPSGGAISFRSGDALYVLPIKRSESK